MGWEKGYMLFSSSHSLSHDCDTYIRIPININQAIRARAPVTRNLLLGSTTRRKTVEGERTMKRYSFIPEDDTKTFCVCVCVYIRKARARGFSCELSVFDSRLLLRSGGEDREVYGGGIIAKSNL